MQLVESVTMLDSRIRAVADAFDELHAFVTTEPALNQLVSATSTLASLARDVRSGKPVSVVVPNDRSLKIPTRELAARILAIVDKAQQALGCAKWTTRGELHEIHSRTAVDIPSA